MVQHRWVEVWLAPFVLKPLSTLSFWDDALEHRTVVPEGPPCSPRRSGFSRGSGVVKLHSDTCAALWAGHGMAAEHSSWMGSSSFGARLPGCSAEQRSELVFPWVSTCHRSRDWPGPCPALQQCLLTPTGYPAPHRQRCPADLGADLAKPIVSVPCMWRHCLAQSCLRVLLFTLGSLPGDSKGPVSHATRGGCRSAPYAPRTHPSPMVQWGEVLVLFSAGTD